MRLSFRKGNNIFMVGTNDLFSVTAFGVLFPADVLLMPDDCPQINHAEVEADVFDEPCMFVPAARLLVGSIINVGNDGSALGENAMDLRQDFSHGLAVGVPSLQPRRFYSVTDICFELWRREDEMVNKSFADGWQNLK